MAEKKSCVLMCVFLMMFSACVSAPKMEKPQFSQWHYTYSVLFDPKLPDDSPRLDLGMSLLQMFYPEEQARFFNDVLYSGDSIDDYANRVLSDQRDNYRNNLSFAGEPDGEADGLSTREPAAWESSNWRYRENVILVGAINKGIVVERMFETYAGGANVLQTKRYYVIDLDSLSLIKIDDLFQDYQGDETRVIVYGELRNYSGLLEDQPLSEGIFLSDEPELSFNFFITEEGLGLHWDPYEITPHSSGGIDIILPWKKIRPLMLHSGMELLTKFSIYLFI